MQKPFEATQELEKLYALSKRLLVEFTPVQMVSTRYEDDVREFTELVVYILLYDKRCQVSDTLRDTILRIVPNIEHDCIVLDGYVLDHLRSLKDWPANDHARKLYFFFSILLGEIDRTQTKLKNEQAV
jgi:hypothetical protein